MWTASFRGLLTLSGCIWDLKKKKIFWRFKWNGEMGRGGAKNRKQKREKSDDSWHGWQLHHIIQNFIKSWKASSSSSKISINYNDPCVCSDSNLERTMQQCFHYVSHALHVRTYNVRLCLRIYCMKHTAPYWAHICSYTETRVYLLPVRYSPSHLNRFGIESIDDVHVQLHGIEWLNSEMSRNGVCVFMCDLTRSLSSISAPGQCVSDGRSESNASRRTNVSISSVCAPDTSSMPGTPSWTCPRQYVDGP